MVDYCDVKLKEHKKLNNWCKPLWDTKLCWPAVVLNETVELPCPKQEFENQTASRTCILYENGVNGGRAIWTLSDYSACPDPDNYSLLFIDIARHKFTEIRNQMWESRLLFLSQCIYALSLSVLLIAFTIFALFHKLRNARTRLHMHMLAAMILQVIMWLIQSVIFDNELLSGYLFLEVLNNIDINFASKVAEDFTTIAEQMFTRFNGYFHYIFIAGLQRYFETATLFWLLMEGWFLYELICHKPLEAKTSIKRYVIIGWGKKLCDITAAINPQIRLFGLGIPILLTSPWMTSHLYSSFNDVYWVKHDVTVYIIAISVFITFMINLYFFVKIVEVLYNKMKISVQMQQKKMEYKTWVRSTFMLVLLFGAQNSLYCAWFFIKKTKPKLIFLFFIKVISSFQGCFVSFIYCFLNQEVRTVLKKNLC